MVNRINNACRFLSSILCLVLVLITVQQVVARYAFNASSVAMQEAQWHIFGAIFLLAIPPALLNNAHVRVDIFYGKFSQKSKAAIDIFGIIFFLIPSAITILYYGWSDMLIARSFDSPVAADHISSNLFIKDSLLFHIFSYVEALLRQTILVGEISPDPGGLEARWLVKSLIPLSAALLLMESLALVAAHLKIICQGRRQS